MAKVSASALEAKNLGLLRDSDVVVFNADELLYVAKARRQRAGRSRLSPAAAGQRQIPVAGDVGIATFKALAGQHAGRRLHLRARLGHRHAHRRHPVRRRRSSAARWSTSNGCWTWSASTSWRWRRCRKDPGTHRAHDEDRQAAAQLTCDRSGIQPQLSANTARAMPAHLFRPPECQRPGSADTSMYSEKPMSKQIQDAYIVAATRTPVGKAPRGMFRNTRPDDLLAHVIRARAGAVPRLDPHRIGDAIVGCAMPEAEQGMNVARIGVLLAGLPDTRARRHRQPLLLVRPAGRGDGGRPHPPRRSRRDDRRRHREHEHGADDGPQARVCNPAIFERREHRHRLRHGHHRREGGRSNGRSRARSRTRSPSTSHRRALAAQRRRRIQRRDQRRYALDDHYPESGHARDHHRQRASSSTTKARAPAPRSKCWPSSRPCSAASGGSVTAGNSARRCPTAPARCCWPAKRRSRNTT